MNDGADVVNMRCSLWLCGVLLCLCSQTPFAQDREAVQMQRQQAPDAEVRNLFLDVGEGLVLTPFRDYDYLSQQRSDSITTASAMYTDVDITGGDDAMRRVLTDSRLAVFGMDVAMGTGAAKEGFAAMLARLLMQQALQFGYQYARERVRAGSLSEMDYLALPQGPGVTRTFDEVGFEARMRGELQSSRVWRDYLDARKNRLPEKENTGR